MTSEKTSGTLNFLNTELTLAKELVYNKCGFKLTELEADAESQEYCACSFKLNELVVKYRASKITPTKPGQFVTIWKRDENGITAPFNSLDKIDLIIINARSGSNCGQFIFPKKVLIEKGIITHNGKEGKRGIRVYPPWDVVSNKQAQKTQIWQSNYFLPIKNDNTTDLEVAKKLFTKE